MNASRLLAILLLLVGAHTAQAMRCDTSLTHSGDYEFQVRDRCGEPFWVETHYRADIYGSDVQQIERDVVYTAWFYNFGPNRLIVRLLFRDGRLVREETLGRGVAEIGDSCGDIGRLARGLSSGELVAYCGAPQSRYEQPGYVTRRLAPGVIRQDEDHREDWIYDLGDADFVFVAHVANGLVEGVERTRR
ncbi:MAG TPA: DUF2845 domain-containing protein [Rudaea sp.]|nr:DUF2845 domain-containing protein [Rudaea sp.]